jgi:hypothetical protein
LSGVWNLDYDKSDIFWRKMILQGWALSGIVTWQTGFPYSAVLPNGTDLNRDGNRRNDRAPGIARNAFNYEDVLSVDPRITKAFAIRGQMRVQLIAEAFNITNESNIADVQRNFYTLNASSQLVPVANFGTPLARSAAVGTDPRTIQLAAKITF